MVVIIIRLIQGIQLDGTHHYYGCLIGFIGDTPASGLVGGFKEGVGGAHRGCRTCMITSKQLCTNVC